MRQFIFVWMHRQQSSSSYRIRSMLFKASVVTDWNHQNHDTWYFFRCFQTISLAFCYSKTFCLHEAASENIKKKSICICSIDLINYSMWDSSGARFIQFVLCVFALSLSLSIERFLFTSKLNNRFGFVSKVFSLFLP